MKELSQTPGLKPPFVPVCNAGLKARSSTAIHANDGGVGTHSSAMVRAVDDDVHDRSCVVPDGTRFSFGSSPGTNVPGYDMPRLTALVDVLAPYVLARKVKKQIPRGLKSPRNNKDYAGLSAARLKPRPFKTGLLLLVIIVSIAAGVVAQEGPKDNKRGITVRAATIYLNPDTGSSKLDEVSRGREVIILEQSRNWLHVLASVKPEKDVNGWIIDKGVVRPDTPEGDKILFGEGAASELIASQRGGRRNAADDARRLYYRVYDYFPKSQLAGEGLYRAADILWQIEAGDIRTRPSAKQRDPKMRPEIDEQYMKLVMKKFSGTKWADLAAFHLLENKMCGDWEGEEECPEKEANMYEKYAVEHPNSPSAPEALYNAAWRRAALIEIYKNQNKVGKVEESRNHAKAAAQEAYSKYPQSDWGYRARTLLYQIEQGIPTWGNVVE